MATVTFDTLEFVKRLKSAGFNDIQAEALAEALRFAQTDAATKADLRELELKIEGELKLIKWMLGILIAGVLSLVTKAFLIH